MITVIYRKRHVSFASGWDELSQRQFIRVIKLLHKKIKNEWFAADAMLRILSNRGFFSFFLLPADLRWRCYEHMKWCFEKQNATKQLIPRYRRFYGPASNFENLLLCEFHHTEIAYQDYILSKGTDIDALDRLIAVLYRLPKTKKAYDRRRDPDGDIRIKFNANEIAWNQRRVKYFPVAVKQAIFTWYDACRQQLFKDYREAFTGKTKRDSYAAGLYEMMRSISGGKYGTLKDVEQLYVHTAFLEIVASKREEKEMEKRIKEAKAKA